MKCLLYSLLLFLSIVSCNQVDPNRSIHARNDRAAHFFEKSKETEDILSKLSLLKSARGEISTPGDTLQAMIYDHLIYYYTVDKKFDSAIYYSNLLIKEGLTTEDTLQIANGYYRKARSFNHKNDQINVLKNTFQSQKYYLLAGDSINAGKRLLELSIAQTRLGDFPGSQTSAVEALSHLENSENNFFIASTYNNLAATYRKLYDLDGAIQEYNNALKYINFPKDSLIVINNIANIHAEKKEFDRSLKLFDSIIPLAEDENSRNRLRDNYYFTLWLNEKVDITDSLVSIMEARNRNNDLTGLLSSYDHLVRVNEEDFPHKALQYAKSYYETARKLNNVSDEISALNYLVRLSPSSKSNKPYALE